MMILAMMMVMTISANAMSYNAAKNEALFLSDKMAYELNLTAAQYEEVYEINLDYLMSLNGHADVFGIWWDCRNADLRYVLNAWQYDKYMSLAHFYRPVAWKAGGWTFAVYSHYNRGHFYNDRPKVFVIYKGGNSHKHDRFYADHHVNKPAPAVHHRSAMPLGSSKNTPTALGNKPVAHNNDNKTSRVPSVASDHRSSGRNNGHSNANVNNGRGHNAGNGNHNTPNRQIAQNTSGHHSGSGHFLRPDGSKRPEVERGGRR